MRISIFLIVVVLYSRALMAQTVVNDLIKINDQHKQHKDYVLKIDYKLFAGHNSSVLQEAYRSTIYRKGDYMVTMIGGMIQANLGRVFIQLDSSEHKIFYAQKLKGEQGQSFDLDSIMKYYDAKSMNEASNAVGKITMEPKANFKNSELSKIELYYNRKNYTVFKMVSYYAYPMFTDKGGSPEPPPRLEAQLGNYETMMIKNHKYFTEGFYVKKVQNKLLPADGFLNYEIIDGRLKK